MMGDQVSIIIPVFNCAEFITEAVSSLRGQLPQLLEILIVDDGSTDDTSKRVAQLSPPVQLIKQPNQGPAAARNTGLQATKGSIIGFLDADDLWTNGSLPILFRELQDHPEIDAVKGLTQFMQQNSKGEFLPLGAPQQFWNPGGALYRRELFQQIGPFNPELRFSEDFDWFLRARELGAVIRVCPIVSQHYRRHTGNMTEGKNAVDLNILKVLKSSLDRRRKAGKEVTP